MQTPNTRSLATQKAARMELDTFTY